MELILNERPRHDPRRSVPPHREEHFSKDAFADATYSIVVPADASLADILATAYAQGMPKWSARAGCYEVQTDAGVWSSPKRGRLNPSTAVFKS